MRTAPRRVAAALGAVLTVTAAATGCGIRATSVPVDAGPAPARVSCVLPSATASASASPSGTSVQLYLLCRSAQVTAVSRVVSATPVATATTASDRLATARLLLAELQSKPDADESAAGLSTSVPGSLDLAGARRRDPADTLRLGVPLDELPPFALAQLVCTFAGTAAGSAGDTVVLGGSDSAAPRRFSCTGDLRTLPDTAQTAGTAVK